MWDDNPGKTDTRKKQKMKKNERVYIKQLTKKI